MDDSDDVGGDMVGLGDVGGGIGGLSIVGEFCMGLG